MALPQAAPGEGPKAIEVQVNASENNPTAIDASAQSTGKTVRDGAAGGGVRPAAAVAARLPHRHIYRDNFGQDFRRFFVRGLAALLPTLITLWMLMKVWEFLWGSIGIYIIVSLRRLAAVTVPGNATATNLRELAATDNMPWYLQVIGVLLAVILVYLVGLFVGHIIGRTAWRIAERTVMRVPLIRAIYPAVKQVTDFVLADKNSQFASARVVAVEPHAKGIWSIALVTGSGLTSLTEALGHEMITVFVPSSPTAFTGYVMVVPRESVVELPLTVEQAMRILVSGGVLDPKLMVQ
jgi:uncharacterized membrane protein